MSGHKRVKEMGAVERRSKVPLSIVRCVTPTDQIGAATPQKKSPII